MVVSGHKAVFLDRDGIINKVLIKDGKPFSPRTMQEFEWEEGVRKAIKKLKDHGFLVIVVTNQPDIAREKMSHEALEAMTNKLYSTLHVDAVLICPHDDKDGCSCRKPNAGMLLEATKKWRIDCQRSFMIGDGWKDMGAGRAAGCTNIMLDRTYNQEVDCDYRIKSLAEAVDIIINQQKTRWNKIIKK